MPRTLQDAEFRNAFDELIVRGHFNEEPGYYPRYRFALLLDGQQIHNARTCSALLRSGYWRRPNGGACEIAMG